MKKACILGIAVLTLAETGNPVRGQSDTELLHQSGRLICTGCGGDGNPSSISEDGRFLLFSGRRFYGEPSRGVFIRDVRTGQAIQIASDPSFSPVLSPDGKHIVYVGDTNPNATFTSGDPGGTSELRVVANQAGAKPRVLHRSPEFLRVTPAAWAPDGKSILAVLRSAKGYAIGWVSASDGTITVLKPLPNRFGCCHEGLPSLSADGKWIAYAASPRTFGDSSHIYVLSADNSVPEVELVKGGNNYSPTWMPDGKTLLFVSDRGGGFGLWLAAIKDGALTLIRADMGDIESVRVSKSGSFFYTRNVIRNAESAFAVQQIGGSPIGSGSFDGELPRWSTDGRSFAFLASERDQLKRAFSVTLHVYSDKTNEERRYVPSGTVKVAWNAPQWFHDGAGVVLWVEESEGAKSPYRVDLETGRFTRISENLIDDPEPVAISSDDRTVYTVVFKAVEEGRCSADTKIVAVDVRSGATRDIVNRAPNTGIVLSADDKTLYMRTCGAGTGGRIAAVDVATGKQRDIYVVKSGESLRQSGLAVSPNNRTLAIITSESPATSGIELASLPTQRLVRIEVDGTGYKELLKNTIPAVDVGNVSWSRDGTEIFLQLRLINERILLRIPSDGGAPRVLARANVVSESLSPDASRFMVVKGLRTEQQLWVLDNVPSLLKAKR